MATFDATEHMQDPERRQRRAAGDERELRQIPIHMIEETARHVGHADIMRELTDGQTGE